MRNRLYGIRQSCARFAQQTLAKKKEEKNRC